MYPGRYFIPNYTTPFMSIPYQTSRMGLFSRIGNTIKSVNVAAHSGWFHVSFKPVSLRGLKVSFMRIDGTVKVILLAAGYFDHSAIS